MPRIPELLEALEYGPAPEDPRPALDWIGGHGGQFGHFVQGGWIGTEAGERIEVRNPATGDRLASIAQGGAPEVDAAVRAAEAAFPAWSSLPGFERARLLYAISRRIQKHARLFAVLETLDNGKPIRETRDIDLPLVARHFLYHAGWAQLREERLPDHRPLGVCAQIIPWNFPLLMLAWKVAPALACGNTVVLKPAEYTPLTALLFAELCAEAGLPPGVLNVVTGDGRTGAELAAHPGIRKLAFTGSTEVGRILRERTAGRPLHLSLELGGKSPFLVFDDADLDSVVEGVVDAIWFNQGQVCCAGSRILVQEGPTAAELERRLRARMSHLRVGDPLDKAMDMGAIIDPVQLDRIRDLLTRGIGEGAQIWQPDLPLPERGCFHLPTLCTGVSPADTLAQVEIFGPVVVLMTFRTPAEAVELANDTRYGLAASVWTEDVNLALDVAPKILAGTVWINCTNQFDAASGFGGYRESGFGREGGIEGLLEYLEPVWAAEDRKRRGGHEGTEAMAASILPDPALIEGGLSGGGGPGRIDRTQKLRIGGKQVRPDGGYSVRIPGAGGGFVAEVPLGNRKDVRNAVEAARRAQPGWAAATAHLRGQILFFLGENLAIRSHEFVDRIRAMTGRSAEEAEREVAASVERCFAFAAWADKWDGLVHPTPMRNVTLAMPEPLGVLGIIAPDEVPLLGVIGTVAPAIAMGNTTVLIPSERHPLAALDLGQVVDTSDVPGGVVNVVTGRRDELAAVLAAHDDVDGVWHFGDAEEGGTVERLSVGNLKRTWVARGARRPWIALRPGEAEEFLRHATQIKNIWVPYGV